MRYWDTFYVFWPQNSIIDVIQVGPPPNGVCINRCTTVPVGVLVREGAGRASAKVFEMWHLLEPCPFFTLACIICPPQFSIPLSPALRVPPHSHFPFSIPHSHQAPLTSGLCSLCPVLGKLCLQLLVHYSLHIMQVLVRGPALARVSFPDTSSSRTALHFHALSQGISFTVVLHTLTPRHKSDILLTHLFSSLLSLLP